MEVEDTDDDGNETDEEVEVTDEDGEEEFDGNTFSVLFAVGKADCLDRKQLSNIKGVLSKAAEPAPCSTTKRAANRCEPLTSYFSKGAYSI